MVYFFIFSIAFLVVFLITPNIRYFALRFSAVDRKANRKIHTRIVTKLGGLGIYLGIMAGFVVAGIFEHGSFRVNLLLIGGLVICATLMLLLGIYDDFQNSRPINKLIMQFVIISLLIRIGFRLEKVYVPGLIDINLGAFSVPVTILWMLGVTNAVNLVDGLDGLAAGIVAIAAFFLCIFGFFFHVDLVIFASLALLGANLAFLYYNFYPAKIFMGDTGSLVLGFIMASLGTYRGKEDGQYNLFFLPVAVLLFLPILDTIFAVVRRALRRQGIFRSDSAHIHHYYIRLGFRQYQAVIRFYVMTFLLGIASLVIIYNYLYY